MRPTERTLKSGRSKERAGGALRATLLVVGLLVLVPATIGARTQETQAAAWQSVLPGLALEFPRDHGAHSTSQTEWWYLTGQVEAEDGRRFGLQFTIFRRGLGPGPTPPGTPSPVLPPGVGGDNARSPLRAEQVLAGHLAVTDVASGRTLFTERLRRVGSALASASTTDLDVVLEDWSLLRRDVGGATGAATGNTTFDDARPGVTEPGTTEQLELRAGDRATGIGLTLTLTPTKPLVLHGEAGYSSKGSEPGNASAYTSWTRLATRGQLELGGESLSVRGTSWFDHEYGSSVLEPGVVGWDWFGLHLDDGRELMCFLLRRADGSFAAASAGTLIDTEGHARPLGPSDYTITSAGTWTSPRTGGIYPASWRIAVPSAGLDVSVTPLVADCEVGTGKSTGVAYWEGPVELRDLSAEGSASAPIVGRGYGELTGYAGTMEGRF